MNSDKTNDHRGKKHYKAILESALDGILTIDSNGIIDSLNPAAEKLFGYKSEELIGEKVNILMGEPHNRNHDLYIRNYIKSGTPKIGCDSSEEPRNIGKGRETFAKRKNGDLFPIYLAVAEFEQQGETWFTGIVRDISKRKEAENQALTTMSELVKSRQNLLAVLNQLRVCSIILEADGSISFISCFCNFIDGLDTEKATGKQIYEVLSLIAESRKRLDHLLKLPESERFRDVMVIQTSQNQYWVETEVMNDPSDPERRFIYLYDISEMYRLKKKLDQASFSSMIGGSPAMLKMYETIDQINRRNWNVLIEGETGTGKELVAGALHRLSPRRDGPFIAFNCASLSKSSLALGLFETADGGSIFLDEVGDIHLNMQAALLRMLEEKEITSLGEATPRKVNVRVIASTQRNLTRMVSEGKFREDLFFRLNQARVEVPPLRHRRTDIPLLIEAFLTSNRLKSPKPVREVSPHAKNLLVNYVWPGNVRELKNAINHAVIRCRGPVIEAQDLPSEITAPVPAGNLENKDERTLIIEVLERSGGNRSRAAALLGVSRTTFYRRLKKFNIQKK